MGSLDTRDLRALQRLAGNRAVGSLLQLQRCGGETHEGCLCLQRSAVDTEDCSTEQKRDIAASVAKAVTMLDNAIRKLKANPVSADTKRHFANHFGAYADWRAAVVVMHLRRTRSLLAGGSATFECESSCDSTERAYTYWIFGDIHLCPAWLGDSDEVERAETLIHEIHHWDPLRGHLDLGYHGNQRNVGTNWLVAVNNADAYSELVQDLL